MEVTQEMVQISLLLVIPFSPPRESGHVGCSIELDTIYLKWAEKYNFFLNDN